MPDWKVVKFRMSDIVQVEVGQAVSGDEFYTPPTEVPGYRQQRGRNETFVPTTTYCPKCSTLLEHDSRTGTVRPKWSTTEEDYCWNVVYDDEGFGVCGNCGHRMSETTEEQLSGETTSSGRAVGEDHAEDYEWIGEAEYEGGYFWFTEQDRRELFQIITRIKREKLKVVPAVLVAGSGYALDMDAFIRVLKECPEKDGLHGIPRQCWRSL
jgi:hypothetical protein